MACAVHLSLSASSSSHSFPRFISSCSLSLKAEDLSFGHILEYYDQYARKVIDLVAKKQVVSFVLLPTPCSATEHLGSRVQPDSFLHGLISFADYFLFLSNNCFFLFFVFLFWCFIFLFPVTPAFNFENPAGKDGVSPLQFPEQRLEQRLSSASYLLCSFWFFCLEHTCFNGTAQIELQSIALWIGQERGNSSIPHSLDLVDWTGIEPKRRKCQLRLGGREQGQRRFVDRELRTSCLHAAIQQTIAITGSEEG
jgi:hypothetical protein